MREVVEAAIEKLENGDYGYSEAEALRAAFERYSSKVQKYEEFLHAINYAMVACNRERVEKLLSNAFAWSYAHRVGNGELTDQEQQAMIDRALEHLTE